MEPFLRFITEWGYIAVFLGAIVEGESVILTACAIAAMGYLNIYKITAITFLTTLAVDQGLFYVGRCYGPAFFERFPKLKTRADKAFSLLHRFDIWFILSFRFIYGIRVISPVVIGASGVVPKRYSPLNFISAIIWTLISCYSGYMLGDLLENILFNLEIVKKYVLYGLGVLLLIALAIIAVNRYKKR